LVGTSTNQQGTGALLQVAATAGTAALSANRYTNTADGPSRLYLFKSRGTSIGTQTIVQDGDDIGEIVFHASDGTDASQAALIRTEVDGTPGNNDMPGRLSFHTTADGAHTPSERMRIDSSGKIGINTAQSSVGGAPSYQTGQLNVLSTAGSGQWAGQFRADNTAGNGLFVRAGNDSSYYTAYLTGSDETNVHMVVRGDGKCGIGTASPTQLLELNGASTPSVQVKDTTNNVICRVGADDTFALLGSRSNHSVKIQQNDATAVTIDTSKNATFAGTVSDSKGNLRIVPQNNKTSSYQLVGSDAGKHITTTAQITVPTGFNAGEMVTIVNNSGSDITIVQGSGLTLYNAGDATTGNRTLAGRGMATILFIGNTAGHISGAGLS
jgi:hypothetical protein